MTYISLVIGFLYLISCPILACLEIPKFDENCSFYLIMPAASYTFYNLKKVLGDYKLEKLKEILVNYFNISKMQRQFIILNLLYIVIVIACAYFLEESKIGIFALYPLILKVVIISLLKIKYKSDNI